MRVFWAGCLCCLVLSTAWAVSPTRSVIYGYHSDHIYDLYLPSQAAPSGKVIVMVNGGGWKHGDKSSPRFNTHKAAHWLAKGDALVSINYRLVPDADPLTQVRDVALAMVSVQKQAKSWGYDANRVVLIGHSTGAHLVALLSGDPEFSAQQGVKPWLGSIMLDNTAYDVESAMKKWHLPLYDHAFGKRPAYWQEASPLRQLRAGAVPLLAVCSNERRDACPEAEAYVQKAQQLGVSAKVMPMELTHMELNELLGVLPEYTQALDAFMSGL